MALSSELLHEVAILDAEMARLDAAIIRCLREQDTNAIHLSGCHAQWAQRRAEIIRMAMDGAHSFSGESLAQAGDNAPTLREAKRNAAKAVEVLL